LESGQFETRDSAAVGGQHAMSAESESFPSWAFGFRQVYCKEADARQGML